jgi:hypothetical protein
MPLRRTQRSDGRPRSRWKDGSHDLVESTLANDSRRDGLTPEPKPRTEPLVAVSPLLEWNHERKVSTRDRPARTGADARIEGSVVTGEARLALRPYGREYKLRFRSHSRTSLLSGSRRYESAPEGRSSLRMRAGTTARSGESPGPRRGQVSKRSLRPVGGDGLCASQVLRARRQLSWIEHQASNRRAICDE